MADSHGLLCPARQGSTEAAVHTLQTGWCYYAGMDAAENTAIPLTAQLCVLRARAPRRRRCTRCRRGGATTRAWTRPKTLQSP